MNEPFVLDNELFLKLEKWEQHTSRLCAGFTTKNRGVSSPPYSTLNCGLHVKDEPSSVLENRKLLADELSVPIQTWVAGEQVHGAKVAMVSKKDRGKGAETMETSLNDVDGLITNDREVLCTAFFADCVPLFFFDPKKELVGIAHAGWKGTVKGIAGSMVEGFRELGSNPADLLIAIGPSISQTNFEVDIKVVENIDHKYQSKVTKHLNNGKFLVDLKKLNLEILLQYGVPRNNIEVTKYCTFEDKNLFFSHRRDGGKTGRMLGFIGLF
ncbi:peptidoglycan editing factor PgeF [Virgibacillus halodenitrificans]|uniref:peptidoglycan editing factor PgeF n=1 Tax=Virgibacillus halodenitrificans TaxID=1482 RepID=UPI002DBB75E3|nr:peptidoglycan editing factor PgeF [Virgibacillus halodenitrificans]MEC2160220.1 peptidoglycan editing factor PgeF [Virgibacillus halodenitrificans]